LMGLAEPFDREAFLLGRNRRLRQLIDEACKPTGKTGGIPFAQILTEIESRPPQKRRPSRGNHRGK
jgi:hypothetical protein